MRSDTVRPAAPLPPRTKLGLLRFLLALRKNPITAFPEEAYNLPILDVGRFHPALLVNDPGEIEHILIGHAGQYGKSAQQRRRLTPALGAGLLTADGETWRATRRVTAPAFSPKAIALLFGDMADATNAMRQRWLERDEPARPLDISAEFQRLAYEIVSRTLFSGLLDESRLQVHNSMAQFLDAMGRIDIARVLKPQNLLPGRVRRRAGAPLRTFRAHAEKLVTCRALDSDAPDLLDRLLRTPLSDTGHPLAMSAVIDNVVTFLAAGHETTANALSWIIYLLAIHPGIAEDVVAEIRKALEGQAPATADFECLVLTRAVVKEAMRLYPPAPFIGREAQSEDRVAGRTVSPGTQVIIAPWVVHRHRRLWANPDSFRPQRFLGPAAQAIPRGAYIPFGLGPRTCIGEGFAVQEIMTVLALILPSFTFRMSEPDAVVPQARVTLRAAGGMRMIVRARSDSRSA